MANNPSTSSPPRARQAGKTVKQSVLQQSPSEDEGDEEESEEPEEEPPAVSLTQTQGTTAASSPTEAPIESLPPEKVTLAELHKWSDSTVYSLDIRTLRWDLKQEWGQIRPLQPAMVHNYYHQLKMNQPRVPVRILVRNLGAGVSRRSGVQLCLYILTDDQYAVIGGQHISAAVKKLYKEYLEKGWKHQDIPEVVRTVQAEILAHETPIQLVRLAAGEHQRLQSETRECSTYDIVRMLGRAIRQKIDKGDSEVLSDAELFLIVQTMGVVHEAKVPKTSKQSKRSAEDLTVCNPLP